MVERVKTSAILVNKGGVTTLGGEVEMEEPCQAWRGKGWTFEGWREIRRHKRRCGARVFRKLGKSKRKRKKKKRKKRSKRSKRRQYRSHPFKTFSIPN